MNREASVHGRSLRSLRGAMQTVCSSARDNNLIWFAAAATTIYTIVFIQQLVLGVETRLMVYLLESALVFLLPLVFMGPRFTKLPSLTDRWDLILFTTIVIAVVASNLALSSVLGLSPRFGFVDVSILLMATTLPFYGRRQIAQFKLPISLIVGFIAVVSVISNENQTFIALVGRHFISFAVWGSGNLLQLSGLSLTLGPDFYIIDGASRLRVEVGIRCGGLDVALIYSLILAAFLWYTPGGALRKLTLLILGVIGALGVNILRVVILTLVYLNYGLSLGDLVHTHLGDLMFLMYIAGFWLVARKTLAARET